MTPSDELEVKKEMARLFRAPTEAEVAELVRVGGDVARRLAFQRDRLVSAIEGEDGWKGENAMLREQLRRLCEQAGRLRTERLELGELVKKQNAEIAGLRLQLGALQRELTLTQAREPGLGLRGGFLLNEPSIRDKNGF